MGTFQNPVNLDFFAENLSKHVYRCERNRSSENNSMDTTSRNNHYCANDPDVKYSAKNFTRRDRRGFFLLIFLFNWINSIIQKV
jgi:hypothetical protein